MRIDDRLKAIISIPGEVLNRTIPFGRSGRGRKLGLAYTASAWVFRCCAAIGNEIADMPWQMKVGDEVLDEDHPAVEKMQAMNSDDNLLDVLRDTVADWKLYGYSVWLPHMLGDRLGHTERLLSNQVTLKGTKRGVSHIEWNDEGFMHEIAREKIILFTSYGALSKIDPDSPVRVILEKARAEQAIDTTVMRHFLDYGIPPYLLQTDQAIFPKDMDRYQSWWEEKMAGISRRWRVLFAGGGLKPFRLRAPIKELALKELREEMRVDICGAFGVPPSIIGAKETAAKSTWRQHMVMFHHNQINPDARYMAGVMNQSLMPMMFEQPKFEFLPEKVEVLQEERSAKSERVVAEVEAGILSRQAAAEILGYEPDQVGEAPIEVTREFAANAEREKLGRKLKKAAKAGSEIKAVGFISEILTSGEIEDIKDEYARNHV